jgi:hypothetical protein
VRMEVAENTFQKRAFFDFLRARPTCCLCGVFYDPELVEFLTKFVIPSKYIYSKISDMFVTNPITIHQS